MDDDLAIGSGERGSGPQVSERPRRRRVSLRMTAHLLVVAGSAGAVAVVAGCGGGDSTQSTSPASASAGAVAIKGFSFMPSSVTVTKGTTVTWTNSDPTTHTVTGSSGGFDSGSLPAGKTFTFTFATAGTYQYHCAIHNYMTGTVVVTG